MREMLKKIKADVVLSAILCIILGIVLFVYTAQATNLICTILALFLIVMGAGHIVTYLMDKNKNTVRLVCGIIVLVIGVWILANPAVVISLIPAIIGVILLLHGIEGIRLAVDTKQANDTTWISGLILSVITIIFGLVLIVRAFEAAQIAFKVVGIALIYDGVSKLFIVSRAAKATRNMEQDFNTVDGEAKEL
ncbi:MAG: HdeD family acid-resistance protein [Roseburia sp.]